MSQGETLESILTNLNAQSRDLRISGPTTVPVNTAGMTLIANPNAYRLALVVVCESPSTRLYLSPVQSTTGVPVATSSFETLPQVIHAAAYPLLVGSAWYCQASGAVNVYVFDITRVN